MANYWIKLYHEILDDTKVGMLRTPLKWRFIECLLVAGENGQDGALPELNKIAWRLRANIDKLETDLNELGDAGLLDLVDGKWNVPKFKKRQEPSASAKRQAAYRKRKKEEARKKEKEKTDKELELELDRYGDKLRNGNITELPPLPAHLATADMLNEWGEWCQYHADKGRPLCRATAKLQFEAFNSLGIEASIAAIKNSIGNNYTGLVSPNNKTGAIEPPGVAAAREIMEEINHGNT